MARPASQYMAIPVEYVEEDGKKVLRKIKGLKSVEGTLMQLTMELEASYYYLRECRSRRHLFLNTYAILRKGETLADWESKRGVWKKYVKKS